MTTTTPHTPVEVREALREWLARAGGKVRPEKLTDELALLENGVISSLQVMELILFIEHLRGRPVDVAMLRVNSFQNIDAIYENFFP